MSAPVGRKNRRQLILEQAMRLFSKQGFDGTSIRTITSACGITEAAIYRHFDNKIHLYEEVIRLKTRQHGITEHLAALPEQECIEAVLLTVAEHILSLGRKDPQLMRLMFSNSLESGTVAAALFKEIRMPYILYVADELERRIALGEVRPVDPFITSRCFVGMVMDCALNVGVWDKISEVEFHAGDVVCNNVPIFARGLQMPVEPVDGPHQGS